MDHPFATLETQLDLAIEQDPLAKLVALLEVAVLVIPQQEQKAGLVAHYAFEHPAAAAGHKAAAHAR